MGYYRAWDPQTWDFDPEPEIRSTSRTFFVVARKEVAYHGLTICKGDVVAVSKGFDYDPESHKVLQYYNSRRVVAKGPAWEDHDPKLYERRMQDVLASRAKHRAKAKA